MHIKLLIYMQQMITVLVYESKTHRSLWARLNGRAESRQPAS
jgi:hypothetical protein